MELCEGWSRWFRNARDLLQPEVWVHRQRESEAPAELNHSRFDQNIVTREARTIGRTSQVA